VVEADLAQPGLTRQRVVATVVWLLDHTLARVGNREYARSNHSYGLTTLREKHVDVHGSQVRFQFTGKSGVEQAVSIEDPRVARIIRRCIELPGYELFQYLDETGARRQVESRDVNDYVRAAAGEDFTAKDFRTWGGTVLAGLTLYEMGEAEIDAAAQKNLVTAIKQVAAHLGNTATVCRQYYVHPALLNAYANGRLLPHYRRHLAGRRRRAHPSLAPEEYAAWTLIQKYPAEDTA
jgi:DNA topoisomerase I